jgi:DNA polymerase (family X)
MIIDNDYIAEQFSLLAKVMDIHGENSFKIKSYSIAAFTLEKLPQPIQEIPPEKITSIKGIGDAIGKKIHEIIHTGKLDLLRQYIDRTPPGVIEMLHIKGLGPKKIATVWKEMEIESIGELLYACEENRLLLFKGFGEKTQDNVQEAIEFYQTSQGSHLYAEVETVAMTLDKKLEEQFGVEKGSFTGAFRRHLEVIESLQWVTTLAAAPLHSFLEGAKCTGILSSGAGNLSFPEEKIVAMTPEGMQLEFMLTDQSQFPILLFNTSCSGEFLEGWKTRTGSQPSGSSSSAPYGSEKEIFSSNGFHFIPPFLREQSSILETAAFHQSAASPDWPGLIEPKDIRAIIHCHSKWSDGSNTLEEMAKGCIEKGYEYMVISDHSKSAGYANGLKEDRILEQHRQIDELNGMLAPFVIFKSIECDILNDGSLDYGDPILSSFDLVIASVHSNLKMSEDKAMMRLLGAIENPYTTILGHLTGRLLLSRPGYPVDHKRIIDACVANKVVIELNAHPRRLDMDWRWIGLALEKGVLISIDPDSHSVEGYKDVKYGVLAAQKAGLTPEKNLSSFGLEKFKAYLAERKKARGI